MSKASQLKQGHDVFLFFYVFPLIMGLYKIYETWSLEMREW